jgi:hypothetical protein
MTGTKTLSYFLFPHMTISAGDYRNLCFFLPHLRVLEIAGKASIPEEVQQKVSGWPVLIGEELSTRIIASIEAYRTFALVHGGPGGILGFLNQAFDEVDETRFKIQEELREKSQSDIAPASIPESGGPFGETSLTLDPVLFQAALFLEIARELDEEELEIASSYDRLGAIELEFREILGIEGDEPERAETNLTPALAPDTNGLLYMLPKRIESWFSMLSSFSLSQIEDLPVFVTCFPEVVEEVVEIVRTACERNGKKFSAVAHQLGSIPGMDGLGSRQFRTLVEAPGNPELLAACGLDLEDFVREAATGEDSTRLEGKKRSFRGAFEKFCLKCEVSGGGKINLAATILKDVALADVPGFLSTPAGSELESGTRTFVLLSVSAVR